MTTTYEVLWTTTTSAGTSSEGCESWHETADQAIAEAERLMRERGPVPRMPSRAVETVWWAVRVETDEWGNREIFPL